MPQSTGQKLATAHTVAAGGVAKNWANPANAYDAGINDNTAATLGTGGIDATNTDCQYLRLEDFNLLAEDGGPIPAGATITRVLFEFRFRTLNGNGGLGLEHRARIRGEVRRDAAIVAGSVVTLNPVAGANGVNGPTTLSADYPGTASSPQTTFARSDFANSASFQIQLTGQRTTGSAGSDGVVSCYWATITVEWVLFADRAGGVKASGTASATVKPLATMAANGGKTLSASGGQPGATVSRGAEGAKATTSGGGQPRPAVTPTGGATSISATAGDAGSTIAPIAPGGGKATAKADDAGSTGQITAAGGGKAAATGAALQTIIVTKVGGGGVGPCVAGGAPHPLVNTTGGGGKAAASAAGPATTRITSTGGGKVGATAGGIGRVYSFSIAGFTRDANGVLLPGTRADVYRTSDHQHMGRTTSDATARYVVAIPLTGNETARFWVRFYKAGTPNRFATTDEDLALIETIVQGPAP